MILTAGLRNGLCLDGRWVEECPQIRRLGSSDIQVILQPEAIKLWNRSRRRPAPKPGKEGQVNTPKLLCPQRTMVCLMGLWNRAQGVMATDSSALSRASPARVKAGFLSNRPTSIAHTVEALASVRKAILASSPLIESFVMADAGLRARPSLD